MKNRKENIKIKIRVDYSKLPNPFHQEQVMKGGKVHQNKSKLIPRKKKYKDKEMDLNDN